MYGESRSGWDCGMGYSEVGDSRPCLGERLVRLLPTDRAPEDA